MVRFCRPNFYLDQNSLVLGCFYSDLFASCTHHKNAGSQLGFAFSEGVKKSPVVGKLLAIWSRELVLAHGW